MSLAATRMVCERMRSPFHASRRLKLCVVRKGASGCGSTGARARCTSQYCLNRISAVSFPTTVPSRSLTFKSHRRSGLILLSFQLHSLRFEQSAHASVGIMHSTAHSKRLQAHEENRRCVALVHCGEHPVLQGVHPIAGDAVVAATCARCGPSSGCAEPSTERRRARGTIVCAHLARRVGSGSAFNGDADRQRPAEAADLGGHTNTQAGSMRRTQPARPHAHQHQHSGLQTHRDARTHTRPGTQAPTRRRARTRVRVRTRRTQPQAGATTCTLASTRDHHAPGGLSHEPFPSVIANSTAENPTLYMASCVQGGIRMWLHPAGTRYGQHDIP